MRYLFVVLFLLSAAGGRVMAQALIPFKYTSEDDNSLVKENDSVRFYIATGDSVNVVSINEEAMYYRLVNRKDKRKVVAEGGLIAAGDGYQQHGRWVQYHGTGKAIITGSYVKGMPAGNWEEYYNDGRLRVSYQYAIITDKDGTGTCLSGEYREYYSNGQLKMSGFYAAERNRAKDTLAVEDPVSGTSIKKTVFRSYYTPAKTGFWEYFSENGEQEKREEF